jgi:hypothetical protein
LNAPVIGVIENMKMSDVSPVRERIKPYGVPYLGGISFDTSIEESVGDRNRLLNTGFARTLREIISPLL